MLYGGGGSDPLTGGTGADTFMFKPLTAMSAAATIMDFHTSQNDKIDLSDLLEGHYDPAHDAIAEFIQLTTSGSDTLLKVDLDGTGTGHSPVRIATIHGVTGSRSKRTSGVSPVVPCTRLSAISRIHQSDAPRSLPS